MVYSLRDLSTFDEWFFRKLIEEKNRRINYIRNTWDNLDKKKREKLIEFINDSFLVRFTPFIIEKSYDELYIVIKDRIENSFEIIENWDKK
ncbi:MAG: hypothetical protein KGD68_08215 [Candidatus Lokiarchaeota archaeon]|nr:hypothetical protein [Candidatus Lokiarchaeota archaeon]